MHFSQQVITALIIAIKKKTVVPKTYVNSLIKKILQYLYAEQEVRKVFKSASFVSFRSVRNFLVRPNVSW